MEVETHSGSVDELIQIAKRSGVSLLWMCRRVTDEGKEGWDYCEEDEDGYQVTANLTLPRLSLGDIQPNTIALVSAIQYEREDMPEFEKYMWQRQILCLVDDTECGPKASIFSGNTGEIKIVPTGAKLTLYIRR